MKTSDLIDQVADAAGIDKGQAKKAVEAVFSSITAAAKQGAEVSLPGFGKIQGQGQPGPPRSQPSHWRGNRDRGVP